MSATGEGLEVPEADPAAAQRALLPAGWRRFDHAIVGTTRVWLFVVGMLFTAMITLEVIARYVFSFSIFFVDAAARFLLVWFFLTGAGIALRHGSHVGFELLVGLLPARTRRSVLRIAQVMALLFFVEMVWAGILALGATYNQTEPGLEIRLVWAFLAIPVGFALLIYHAVVLIVVGWRRPAAGGAAP